MTLHSRASRRPNKRDSGFALQNTLLMKKRMFPSQSIAELKGLVLAIRAFKPTSLLCLSLILLVHRAMAVVKECELLKIQDILPCFTDFVTIDDFQVCCPFVGPTQCVCIYARDTDRDVSIGWSFTECVVCIIDGVQRRHHKPQGRHGRHNSHGCHYPPRPCKSQKQVISAHSFGLFPCSTFFVLELFIFSYSSSVYSSSHADAMSSARRCRMYVLTAAEPCQLCQYPVFDRQFYLFACKHAFHADCLTKEVCMTSIVGNLTALALDVVSIAHSIA